MHSTLLQMRWKVTKDYLSVGLFFFRFDPYANPETDNTISENLEEKGRFTWDKTLEFKQELLCT